MRRKHDDWSDLFFIKGIIHRQEKVIKENKKRFQQRIQNKDQKSKNSN
jgi:hypothetical protein